jgi:hypothetical protein
MLKLSIGCKGFPLPSLSTSVKAPVCAMVAVDILNTVSKEFLGAKLGKVPYLGGDVVLKTYLRRIRGSLSTSCAIGHQMSITSASRGSGGTPQGGRAMLDANLEIVHRRIQD